MRTAEETTCSARNQTGALSHPCSSKYEPDARLLTNLRLVPRACCRRLAPRTGCGLDAGQHGAGQVRVYCHPRALARSCARNLPAKRSPARRPAPGAAPDGDYDAEEGLTFETSKGIRVVQTFDDMRLKYFLMRGI